jgi:hypothetical protein
MSNFNRFLTGGKKKGVEAPKPKAGTAAPLVDEKATRQVDLSAAARADAQRAAEGERTLEVAGMAAPAPSAPVEEADDEKVTQEVVVKPPKAPPYPVPVPSPPATEEGYKAPPPKRSRPPISAVPSPAAAEEAAPQAEAAAPEKKPEIDIPALLEKIKATVKGLLKPVEDKLAELEGKVAGLADDVASAKETAEGNDEMITEILTSIEGPAPNAPDEEKADKDGKPVLGLRGELSLLRAQLLGANPAKVLAEFENESPIALLFEQVVENTTNLHEVIGKNGERIPSLVNDNAKLTAKTLVIEMLKPEPDEAKLKQASIERGPDTAKDVLAALAGSEEYAVEVVGALYLEPAESLETADKKEQIIASAKAVGQRAQFYLGRLDWEALEQQALDYRAPEPENTGGDE